MILRSVMCCLFVVGFVAVSGAAADEHRRAIVVPVELGGIFAARVQYRREVDRALENRLLAGRFVVRPSATLSPAESDCREFDCLSAIGQKHEADLVVAARLISDQKVMVSYRLRVRVAERVSGSVSTREREADCQDCTEPQARDKLAALMSATIANEPEPVIAPPTTTNEKPTAQPQPQPQHHDEVPIVNPPLVPTTTTVDRFSSRQKLAFGLTAGGLWLVGGLCIAQGGYEKHRDGYHAVINGHPSIRDTGNSQALYFSLGTIAVLGGVGAAVAAWGPWKKNITIMPSASATSVQAQVSGTF